jgi:site-specific recombinase XerD
MEGMIQAFRTHLVRLGYSEGMTRMLPACVAEFTAWAGQSPQQIAATDIQDYYHYLQQRPNKRRGGGLSEMMIHHQLYSLRVWFDYLEQTGLVAAHPMSGLSFPQPHHQKREILGEGEIQLLFNSARSLRVKAVLHLCYSCGLRRWEAVQLDVRDIHFRNQLLYVRRGKGGVRRVIPFTARTGQDLWHYYQYERAEEERAGRPMEAFLLNSRGGRLQGNAMNRMVSELVAKAGIDKAISLHSLRHSIATHLLAGGMTLERVRDFLGHKHLETTQLYTRVEATGLFVPTHPEKGDI